MPLLTITGATKSFGAVRALEDVSLALAAGEVHALMGENGAGKSTLMKILAGLHQPDAGEIRLRGKPVQIRSPHHAQQLGIAMIHQELMPVPDLTVAENILLGHEPASRFLGWLDKRAMRDEARRLLALLGVDLDVTRPMRELSVAQMQTVEIARALGLKADVVIMDEPTAAISAREADALFGAIATLKQRGVAIVYITHKMDEVFRIADTITVLRDGKLAGTFPARELDDRKLIALMVGRDLNAIFPIPGKQAGEVTLSVRGLGRTGAFRDATFDLHAGEILGFAGLMGAGRTELVSALFGLEPADTGEILVRGKPVRIRKPADAIARGIGMVTEDRKGYGLVATMSVGANVTLAALAKFCRGPFVDKAREHTAVDESIRALSIRTAPDGRRSVGQLSGGNQQKVVIARSLLAGPSIVILDEPTRGIDIGAKAEVYAIVAQLAREGRSVILVSSELPEVLSLSHRLLVMRQGAIVAELDPRTTSQEEVLRHAMPA